MFDDSYISRRSLFNKNHGIHGHAASPMFSHHHWIQIEAQDSSGRITDQRANGSGALTKCGNIHRRITSDPVEERGNAQPTQRTLDPLDREWREDHGEIWHDFNIAPPIPHQ
jgi:hypothetical protein